MEDKNFNIERIVIIKLIEEPESIHLVSASFFIDPLAIYLFECINIKIKSKAVYFDAATIAQEYSNKEFPTFNIFNYLTDIVCPIEGAQFYIALLKDNFFRRELKLQLMKDLKFLDEKNSDYYTCFENYEKIKERAESAVSIQGETLQKNLNTSINEMYERIERFKSGIVDFQTGKKSLDEMLTFQNGDLVLIAARPSMGKTSLAVDLAVDFARNKKKGAFISVEVSKLNLTNKILLSENEGIDSSKFRKGQLNDQECERIEESLNLFNDLEIIIEDKPSYIDDIVRTLTILKRKENIQYGIIDYIQLIKVEKDHGATENTSEISKKIKSCAKDLNIPIFALSQLNRGVENRGDNNYQLSDLKNSGSLEEDADIIMFCFRQYRVDQLSGLDMGDDWLDQNKRTMDLQIRKNRNGECGDVLLYHNKTVTKFYDKDVAFNRGIDDDIDSILNSNDNKDF